MRIERRGSRSLRLSMGGLRCITAWKGKDPKGRRRGSGLDEVGGGGRATVFLGFRSEGSGWE